MSTNQKRIDQLPAATTPLAGTEVLPIVQGGVAKQVAVDDLGGGGFPEFSTLADAGTSFNGDWFIIDRGLTENYLRVSTHNIHGGAIASTCKNVSGGTLAKGTPVYQVGVQGQSITVAAADASDPAKMPAVGVLNQALADEAEGEILFLGNIQGVNTNAFAAGDAVYVAVGGGYTNIRPAPPNISQYLGTVLRISSTSGSGQLLGTGVADPAISNLADTNITSPSDGDVLTYDDATETWVAAAGSVPSNVVVSDTTGVAGADQITNIMSLTQAEYDAITPNASTLYVITA